MRRRILLRFLGTPQVERDGKPIEGFRSRKALALLGYLAVEKHPVPRSRLADLLWEGMEESRGRANLSWVVNRISLLIPECLVTDRHTVQLRRSPTCWLDIDELEAWEERTSTEALAAAVEQYRGAFLDGISLTGCAEFEIWLAGEREHWRRRAAQGLETLVARYSQRGAHETALRCSRRLLELEPWRERTHRSVMRLLARCGRHSAAMAQYESCRVLLAEALGVEPTQKTAGLYERIRRTREAPRHNLPPQPMPVIGRDRETTELIRLLADPHCRLLTLLGPGGVGKTRVALEVASAKTDDFLEGVWFVPLSSVSSTQFLVSAIAEALSVSVSGQMNAQVALLNHLRGKEMMLILDGFEHLTDASSLLVEILQEAPEVKLLVTSLVSLNLSWEWRYQVEGLQYPIDPDTDAEGPQDYGAVALFYQAARRVNPRFSTTPAERQAVATICQLVEGMPLAIELAAAWVKTRTCDQIAREIQEDLGFLTSSLQDTPARHGSIRAAFEHSWRLLTPLERRTFMGLSVFRHGFSERAAGDVVGASEEMLESLVNKSLLRFARSDRYDVHNLLRQFAGEKLEGSPTAYAQARERHMAHYMAQLRSLERNPGHEQEIAVLTAMRPEMANIRAAWGWAAQEGRLHEIERSLGSLSRFYLLGGPYSEGESLIRGAVDHLEALEQSRTDGSETSAEDLKHGIARLRAEQARFLNREGRYDEAIYAARTAISLSSGSDGKGEAVRAEASAYLQWGRALLRQGAYAESEMQLNRALVLCGLLPLQRVKVDCMRSLGNAYHGRGDYASASDCYQKALSISRELGDERSEGMLLASIGLAAHQQGLYGEARAYYERALALSRDRGDRWSESLALINLGYILDQHGAYAEAETRYRQCLEISQETHDRQSESMALSCLGLLFHHRGDDQTASGFSERSVEIAQAIGARRVQGYALTRLGHSLLELGCVRAAKAAYRQAIDIRQELGARGRLLESRAGLVRALLAQDDLAEANREVEDILSKLPTSSLNDTDEPLRIRLTCYRALRASEDPRAASMIQEAHQRLQQRAASIADRDLRHSFLENVAAHREIAEAYEGLQRARPGFSAHDRG